MTAPAAPAICPLCGQPADLITPGGPPVVATPTVDPRPSQASPSPSERVDRALAARTDAVRAAAIEGWGVRDDEKA